MAIVAAMLTFAYIGRFWLGVFGGPRRSEASGERAGLVAPVAFLALVALAGGLVPGLFAGLAQDAAEVTNAGPVSVSPAYHLDARAENLMALAAWALGALALAFPRVRDTAAGLFARAGDRMGPRRAYRVGLRALNSVSDRVQEMEVRDLRNSLAAVLVPSVLLVALGFAATPTSGAYVVGAVEGRDLPVLAVLALAVVAALSLAFDRARVRMVLSLSVVGFALAAVYEVIGAPDVALVAVVVETVITLVFLGILARLPRQGEADLSQRRIRRRRARNAVVGVLAGAAAFATIWAGLSRPTVAEGDAAEHIARTPDAHGGDVVTVILADFRGLDTLGEITVLTLAVVGFSALLRRGRIW
jgi:multicomponent Na+:H+ antiporter subunit A